MRFRKIAFIAATAAAGVFVATLATSGATASPRAAVRWSASWASSMQPAFPGTDPMGGSSWAEAGFTHETVRQVVQVSAAGSQVRVRLSNRYGTQPVEIAGATVAKTGTGASVQPGSVRRLTFQGSRTTTIPAGDSTASDGVAMPVTPLESVTVTLYFAGSTGPATFHDDGLATSYRATGDHGSDVAADAFDATSHSFYYLTGVDVTGQPARNTVVTFGDSVTNGHNSTVDANHRYSDGLADRLAASHRPLGVVNAGISGNLLLNQLPCFGEAGVDRFRRDALEQPGVRTVILLEGTNDIWDSEASYGCGVTPRVTADQLISGYKTLIAAAHARGVRVIGGTIIPFKAVYMQPADFARAEAIREQVNTWIQTSGQYDGVIDFARAVADPTDPEQLNPAYNSGDSLHPNDAGYRAMAAAVNLNLL